MTTPPRTAFTVTAATPAPRTVLLDQTQLAALAHNPAARAALPELAALAARPGCGACAAKQKAAADKAKAALLALPPDRLAALKAVVSADRLGVAVRGADGVVRVEER